MSDVLRAEVRALMPRAKQDLAELVTYRSVANPEVEPAQECEKVARWIVDAYTELGFEDVQASPTPDGSKAVHGVSHGPDGSPTVLLYSHYDVQPSLGEQHWQVPVWQLTEKDGRWYGRGTADCKGNIVMQLTALRALKKVHGSLPCTVKIISEGSEEQGTGGLEAFVPQNPDLLRADAICVVDTGNFAVGVPTLTTSLRGMVAVDIRLDALGSVMHSGMFGGPAPDPVAGLIQVLSSLHDEHGDTTVDGIADGQTWTGAQYPPEQFRKDAQVLDGVDLTGTASVSDMLWTRPAATVVGIDIPNIVDSASAIAATCGARISLRIPYGETGQAAIAKLTEHLRRRVPWNLRCTITPVAEGDPFLGSLGGPAFSSMTSAMEQAFGRGLTTEGQGGSIPLCNVLDETFPEAEIMLYGVEEPRCLIHAPNESVDPSEIENVALAQALFLVGYGAARS